MVNMAERGRFELPVGYKPTHAFQACALNHSAISPASKLHSEEALQPTQYFSFCNGTPHPGPSRVKAARNCSAGVRPPVIFPRANLDIPPKNWQIISMTFSLPTTVDHRHASVRRLPQALSLLACAGVLLSLNEA